jgi:hypothetical protein
MSGLYSLLGLNIVGKLLQCDMTIYGNVVRECFRRDDMREYVASSTIMAYGPRKMQNMLQRCIFDICVSGPSNDVIVADYSTCTYRVRLDHDSVDVTTLRVSYVSQYRLVPGAVGSASDFDVSSLQLSRTGLTMRYVPVELIMHPCPLQVVVQACVLGMFRVVAPPVSEEAEDFLIRRIDNFVRRGWTHVDCALEVVADNPVDDRCAICLADSDREGDWVRLRHCGHSFHMQCYAQHAHTTTLLQPVYPRTVSCPMCRAVTKSYELAPTILLLMN